MANTQINIGANGTTTLATKGKFCDRNIDVNVSVPASGITPSGTKAITSNGLHDVSAFANVQVDVPIPSGYIKPSGSINITENNKTVDVSAYASAVVNVPAAVQNFHLYPINVSSDWTGTAAEHTILSGNEFVKAHYADEGFFAMWLPLNTPASAASGITGWVYQGNRPMIKTAITAYGVLARSTSPTSNPNWMPASAKISGSGYNVSFRAKSNGNLTIYRASSYTIPAGNYLLLMGLAE